MAETADQRKRRLAKKKHEREQVRQRLVAEDDDAVFSFDEWCALVSISRRQGRDLLASGDGPVVTQISPRRIGISRVAHREWLKRRARPRTNDGK